MIQEVQKPHGDDGVPNSGVLFDADVDNAT